MRRVPRRDGVRTSGLRAAFFWRPPVALLLALLTALSGGTGVAAHAGTSADLTSMAAHPVWQALLHLHDGQPQIDDPAFLRSAPDFSAEAEWQATRAALSGPDAEAEVCRMPARYLWLRAQGVIGELPLSRCADWQDFSGRAPASRISLVFASENPAQPSSMMGHLFFKLEGRRADGEEVAHALSFYTDAGTWNLPLLLYESLVTGKPGWFALGPHDETVRHYVVGEGRTLWEYDLALTPDQAALLQAHLLELRSARIRYLFQDHNCATLVRDLLRIMQPVAAANAPASPWITPRRVLREQTARGTPRADRVYTPAAWRVRTLRGGLDHAEIERALEAVRRAGQPQGDTAHEARVPATDTTDLLPTDLSGLQALEFTRAWAGLELARGRLGPAQWQRLSTAIDTRRAARPAGESLAVDAQMDPSLTPPEARWSLGRERRGPRDGWSLRLMPVSHALEDDHRHRLGESALQLFDLGLRLENDRLRLQHLVVYGVTSLLPHDALAGGWSGRFALGALPQARADRTTAVAASVEGALGQTLRVHPDIDLYALAGGGLGLHRGLWLSWQQEAGLIVREVGGLKTLLRWRHESRPDGGPRSATHWQWTQMLRLSSGWQLGLEAGRIAQGAQRQRRIGLQLTHLL
ncbi:MAG: hypothetical protein RLY78_3218 [Pseudomonadota bacterium]|jgi:hypothetical protein